jgi:hypothetical protein
MEILFYVLKFFQPANLSVAISVLVFKSCQVRRVRLPAFFLAREFEHRRKMISKSFHHQLKMSDRQPLVGENVNQS